MSGRIRGRVMTGNGFVYRRTVRDYERRGDCMNRWPGCLVLTLFILLLFSPANVFSESPWQKHPPLLVSQHGSVFIVIHEDESADLAPVIAKMEHDIHALEAVFRQMLEDGRLDGRYGTLVINAGFYGSATARFSHAATKLYRTNRVALSGWPLSLDHIVRLRESGARRGEVLNLGRAYVIDTSTGLLTVNDLLALIHLLPAAKEIRNEAELSAAKEQIPPGLVEGMSLGIGPPWVWSYVHVGGDYFTAIWQGGLVTYYLRTTRDGEKVALPVLPHYLLKPVWGEWFPRLMVYADEKVLTVIDRHKNKRFTVNLPDLPGLSGLKINELALAADSQQDRIAFSFREERALGRAASFFLDLQDGRVSPMAGEFFEQLQAMGLTEATWAWHKNRDADWGKPLAALLVKRGVLSERESETLIFLPTLFGSDFDTFGIRLLAYGSREELVIKDIIADTTESIDLQAFYPEGYNAVDNIDLYSNEFGDEICIVLSGEGIEPAAYVWRIGTGLLGRTETVPTELNPAGWARMHRGTPDFLFRDIRLDTGRLAAMKPWGIWLSALAKVILEVTLWSVVLVSCFGLPYVLAHLITIKIALFRAKAAEAPASAPVLSGILFILLSALVIFAAGNIFPTNMAGRELPSPWGDPTSMRADLIMLFVIILFVPATIMLAVLNGRQAMLLLRGRQGIAESKKKWDFWGMGSAMQRTDGKRRLPLHCYATFLGCLSLMAILFGSRLGVYLDIEVGWLIFCLIVLIPYTFARPLSIFVARKIVQGG